MIVRMPVVSASSGAPEHILQHALLLFMIGFAM
jgi:hypothetical protein